jgi:hypothetical protein
MAGGVLDPAWAGSRIISGMVSGEGLIYQVRDPTYKLVDIKDKGRVVGQQKVLVDPGEPDKRLLVVETEMSRVLKAMGRDSNTLSEVLRQAWDSGTLVTAAKNSGNRATGAHITLVCHITSADLRTHLEESDTLNGFANRFLWLLARRSKSLPDGGDMEGPEFERSWGPVRHELQQVQQFAAQVGRIRRDPQATRFWHSIYDRLSGGRPGVLGALLSRAEAHVVRLAAIHAVLDRSPLVKVEHLKAALALWDYAERCVGLVFADRTRDSGEMKILAALRENPEGMTRKDITLKVFARHRTRREIAAMFSNLLSAGLIHRAPPAEVKGPGRPVELWRIGRVSPERGS